MRTAKNKRLLSVSTMGLLLLLGSELRAEETTGSFWYALDHLTSAKVDAEALIWVALPATWHGQELKITMIQPEPVAVLEDPTTGNRVIEWIYRPGDGGLPMNRFFHFDFTLKMKPVLLDVDPAKVGAYDRESAEYLTYTRPEAWIQTDSMVREAAHEIIGAETDHWLQTKALFEWCAQSMTFVPGGSGKRDALSTLANRRGDCGQYSRLFVAFCRSIGIPARTVTNEWLSGGSHVFAEVLMPGYGWVPADISLAQMLLPGSGGLSEEEVASFMARRGVPLGDPDWFLGHLFGHRLITAVGNNITIDSPTLGRKITFQSMKPGGDKAHPGAFRIEGFNEDMVHGGFFVFGEQPTKLDEVRDLTHVRLAKKFFNLGLYDIVEDGCRKSLHEGSGGVQQWINMGKVHMHRGEYLKAEASFRRAMGGVAELRGEKLEARIWTHNYLGNCYDMLKHRDLALREYAIVVGMGNNYRGAVDYARRFLAKPFDRKVPSPEHGR